ncbi:MAG: hypothetical protein ACLGHC_06230 [Alphaproteobacteria bacterium]
MTGNEGNERADMAKRNDDSELIERAQDIDTPGGHQGSAGGALQLDVGSAAELRQVEDPAAVQRVTKCAKRDHDQHSDAPKPADQAVTER